MDTGLITPTASASSFAALSSEASILKSAGSSKAIESDPKELESRARVDKAAKEFESIFISMMMKELRQTQSGEGLFPGDKSDTFGGMFDMMMGQHIADGGGIGMTEFLKNAGGGPGAKHANPFAENKLKALAAYQSTQSELIPHQE